MHLNRAAQAYIVAGIFILSSVLLFLNYTSIANSDEPNARVSDAEIETPHHGPIHIPTFIKQMEEGRILPETLADLLVTLAASSSELPVELQDVKIRNKALKEAVRAVILSKTVEVLVKKTSVSALGLKKFSEKTFGKRSEITRSLSRLISLIERLEYVEATQDITVLRGLRDNLKSVVEESLMASRIVALLHKLAETNLKNGKAMQALVQLAEVDSSMRTEQTIQLAHKSVLELERLIEREHYSAFTEEWPFDDENVSNLISELIERNEGVKNILSLVYSRRVLLLVERNDLQRAENSYYKTLELRPDFNHLNEELRLEIAYAASTLSARNFARKRLEELRQRRPLTTFVKIRLAFCGYYNGYYLPVLYSALGISLILVLIFYMRDYYFVARADSEHGEALVPGHDVISTREDEYTRLLGVLELKDSASMEDIKQSYRRLAKNYHPDSNANSEQSEENARKFVELKKVYERILEMRKGLFRK